MGTVIVDGREIEIRDGERLNGIEVAARVGIEIPHYCWHPGLSVVASCRMCLVETGRRDPQTGKISMLDKLVPACQTPATDGTVFVTSSDKVKAARAMVEEGLLLRHPIDCSICDKAGECRLQDYHFLHGQDKRRADIKPFSSRRRELGDTITLFVDRCIMCTRCVRFCREITETNELLVINRGAHEEIDIFEGFPLDNPMTGNVADLCPVGALGDKDFLYTQRVWFMTRHAHVCAGCATGCSIFVEENQDRIYRLKPRENMDVNRWWMCDEGRYGWKHVHDERRWVHPRRRVDGQWLAVDWSEVVNELDQAIRKAKQPAVVVSPHLTVEEAYMLSRYVRGIHPDAALVLGPIPESGEDRSFTNGLTIRSEKCPNRKGVQEVISQIGGGLLTWDAWLARLSEDNPHDFIWIAGGYKTNWNDESIAQQLGTAEVLVVQDLFDSAIANCATWQLPATAFAERSGSYVNQQCRLQTFSWAIRPPQGVLGEGPLYWRLLGNDGLYDAARIRSEVARKLAFFTLAAGDVPSTGVDLRINQLA